MTVINIHNLNSSYLLSVQQSKLIGNLNFSISEQNAVRRDLARIPQSERAEVTAYAIDLLEGHSEVEVVRGIIHLIAGISQNSRKVFVQSLDRFIKEKIDRHNAIDFLKTLIEIPAERVEQIIYYAERLTYEGGTERVCSLINVLNAVPSENLSIIVQNTQTLIENLRPEGYQRKELSVYGRVRTFFYPFNYDYYTLAALRILPLIPLDQQEHVIGCMLDTVLKFNNLSEEELKSAMLALALVDASNRMEAGNFIHELFCQYFSYDSNFWAQDILKITMVLDLYIRAKTPIEYWENIYKCAIAACIHPDFYQMDRGHVFFSDRPSYLKQHEVQKANAKDALRTIAKCSPEMMEEFVYKELRVPSPIETPEYSSGSEGCFPG